MNYTLEVALSFIRMAEGQCYCWYLFNKLALTELIFIIYHQLVFYHIILLLISGQNLMNLCTYIIHIG